MRYLKYLKRLRSITHDGPLLMSDMSICHLNFKAKKPTSAVTLLGQLHTGHNVIKSCVTASLPNKLQPKRHQTKKKVVAKMFWIFGIKSQDSYWLKVGAVLLSLELFFQKIV